MTCHSSAKPLSLLPHHGWHGSAMGLIFCLMHKLVSRIRFFKARVKRALTLTTFLRVAAWALVCFAGVTASSGILLVVAGDEEWRQVLPVATLAFVASGVLLTLAGHLFTQARDVKEAKERRSAFYLDSCVKAYEEARTLLADDNNDRVTWIAAARSLGHAKALANGVTEDAHQRVLELHRLKYRTFFDSCLRNKPAAFFYGAKDSSMTAEEAAAAHSAREERNGRTVISAVRSICTQSIRRVWEASQWPDNYTHTDPVGPDFSEAERRALFVRYQGVYEYVERLDTFGSAKVSRRERQD